MHYIRFLKSPSLITGSSDRRSAQVSARLTITTDLGEYFLTSDLRITVALVGQDSVILRQHQKIYDWKSGQRQLDVSLHLASSSRVLWPCQMVVRTVDNQDSLVSLKDIFTSSDLLRTAALVFPAISEPIYLSSPGVGGVRKIGRRLRLPNADELVIWEETGESIARHIWDAGLVLSSILSHVLISHTSHPVSVQLHELLRKEDLRALELGTGCGIVGITLAACSVSVSVTLTDLPDAEEIANYNLQCNNLNTTSEDQPRVTYKNLDWETELPDELKNGELDLVLVADCTYNPDVVPDLVKTLNELLEYNRKAKVLLAMKVRHDSEKIFFELMTARKMKIDERIVVSLPMLGDEDQEVEIYVFFKEEQ